MAPESHDTIFSSTASSSRRTQWVEILSCKVCLFISKQHLWRFNEIFLQFSYYRIANRYRFFIGKIGKISVLPILGGYRSAKPSPSNGCRYYPSRTSANFEGFLTPPPFCWQFPILQIEDILNGWSLIILGFAVVVPPKSFRSMFLVCGLGNLCWI